MKFGWRFLGFPGAFFALLLASCGPAEKAKPAPANPAPRPVRVGRVELRPMERTLPVVGTLSARDEATVSAQVAGQIEKNHVDFGDRVTAGQELVLIDVAAYEALVRQSASNLARATAKTTFPVWQMNAIGDLTLHNARGDAPWWYRPVGSLFDQFLGAAETDPVLAEWFLRRFSLLDTLYMVPPPAILGRAIRHNMRLWWTGKRTARASARDRDPAPSR